ncbi:hypothetical protein ACHAWO_000294 [Cyclotella atomus]|uniref:Post-GPI attachment to proteins factor 3 n=1 Tax=Cyclotella atomus TaxID=382360 RepID=A0ABD3PBW1_9STRA
MVRARQIRWCVFLMGLVESVNLSTSLFAMIRVDQGCSPLYHRDTRYCFSLSALTHLLNPTMAQHKGKLLVECFTQPSFLSITQCIKSDFLLKSQTNFYIPPDAYGGYSYLNEETTPHPHGHASHLFVAAEPAGGLHSHQMHHHGQYLPFPSHNFSNCEFLHLPIMHTTGYNIDHPMTVPYIHPELQRPVPPLELPKYFGALCFSFTLGGIMMLHWVPRWTRGHWFPYRFFAWALILFQGPCSFLADYVHMTNNSPWHQIDRFLACLLMSLEMIKLIVMRPHTRPALYALYLIGVSMAIGCFIKSQESQRELDTDGFIFWHCGWHCYPIFGTALVGLDKWIGIHYGEYYSFKEKEAYKRGEGGGLLLSTIVMEYLYGTEECRGRKAKWKVSNYRKEE